MYSAGATPTLLDGSGNDKAIKNPQTVIKGPNDLQSPEYSRNSSAQGSYSTSATTFDEGEDGRGRNSSSVNNETEDKRKNSGREVKGNVIVSVRVRPEAGGDKTSGKDWLVDGRQSLIAYRGREGGNYVYGKQDSLFDMSTHTM